MCFFSFSRTQIPKTCIQIHFLNFSTVLPIIAKNWPKIGKHYKKNVNICGLPIFFFFCNSKSIIVRTWNFIQIMAIFRDFWCTFLMVLVFFVILARYHYAICHLKFESFPSFSRKIIIKIFWLIMKRSYNVSRTLFLRV